MKLALFAAALLLGGAAYAQTGMPAAQPGATAPAGATVAPSNEAPKRDARGIPVISADAAPPPGWNAPPSVGGTGVSPSAPAAPMAAAGPLPPCSRKVTDHCTQTYERHHGDTAMATTGAATTADTAAATDDSATTTGTKKMHHRRRHRG